MKFGVNRSETVYFFPTPARRDIQETDAESLFLTGSSHSI